MCGCRPLTQLIVITYKENQAPVETIRWVNAGSADMHLWKMRQDKSACHSGWLTGGDSGATVRLEHHREPRCLGLTRSSVCFLHTAVLLSSRRGGRWQFVALVEHFLEKKKKKEVCRLVTFPLNDSPSSGLIHNSCPRAKRKQTPQTRVNVKKNLHLARTIVLHC